MSTEAMEVSEVADGGDGGDAADGSVGRSRQLEVTAVEALWPLLLLLSASVRVD